MKTIMFDLDGTLLPLDQDYFLKVYFGLLTQAAATDKVDAKAIMQGLKVGVKAMMANQGPKSNMEEFEESFLAFLGEDARPCLAAFDRFYETGFDRLIEVCGQDPRLPALVHRLKDRGCRVVVATSPMLPEIAIHKRIRWAGLDPDDFAWITTCENAHHTKPDPAYYADILEILGCQATDCVMVGNDVDEDMVAGTLGMDVFLLTDHVVNRGNKDISCYPHGDPDALAAWLDKILERA